MGVNEDRDVRADWYARPAARSWTCPSPATDPMTFHRKLPGYAPTPLTDVPALAVGLGVGRLFVKDESARLGLGAFKALGASWAVARILSDRSGIAGLVDLADLRRLVIDDPIRLVTATDGNHGRAVAWMARLVGAAAEVFVPEIISSATRDRIAGEGATVRMVPGSYDDAVAAASARADQDQSAVLVQDTAWLGYERVPSLIVDGYATLMIEIDEQLTEIGCAGPDLVAVPVGVGSLAQAVVVHCRSRASGRAPAVLSVEPDTAACVLSSLQHGAPRSVPTAETVMAGLNCGTPSTLAWQVLRDGLDAAIAVSDRAVMQAVEDIAALGISSGPSGASTLAGARVALAGPERDHRRGDLGVGADSVVVLLSTEADHASRRSIAVVPAGDGSE